MSPAGLSRDAARLGGLYAIADTAVIRAGALATAVKAALDGGARAIQYRDKGGDPRRRGLEARSLARLCRDAGALFIVNDDATLAAEADADGVHLGREDAALDECRHRLGAQAIIGVSCYNRLELAIEAERNGADYVAFGSFFASAVKPDAVHATLELLRAARARLRVPIAAIGGITPENAPALVAAGADFLAVITGVFSQPDIEAAARRYAALYL
jgi:thiamine-phosphate pyrophosphorylase